MKNRNKPALTHKGKVKGKGESYRNSELPSLGDGKTVSFVEGINLTAKRRKYGIATISSVQIKVANY